MRHPFESGFSPLYGRFRPFEGPLPTGKQARYPLRHRGYKNSAPLLSHLRYFEVQILTERLSPLQSIFPRMQKNLIKRICPEYEIDDADSVGDFWSGCMT